MVHNINTQDNPVPLVNDSISDTFLCSYSIASAEMRFNEICTRDIFLRVDPDLGPIIRGEISGCNRGGFANLNQIFLEFALSCEGCKDQVVAEKSVICFGQHLGSIFVPSLQLDKSRLPSIYNLSNAMKCILNSMNITFKVRSSKEYLNFTLASCPLYESAQQTGLCRGLKDARIGYITFIEQVVQILEPNWNLISPSQDDQIKPLLEISISQNRFL